MLLQAFIIGAHLLNWF